jgi:alkanesulfonate monooxygenase SsuD/methylene tetrahydromethanopterin reductase-like flavin-dependent oxidoreductase (luciferase family)
MAVREAVFGFGAHNGIADASEWLRLTEQADRDGLDVFSLSDHPYVGSRLDAYAAIGLALGRTERLAGFANVSNLPTRPPAMLARTVTTLSALTGGRVVLGMGAGRLSPGAAVEAFEEAIVLIKKLCGGGPPVTFEGRHYRADQLEPAPVPAPPVWTGSVGPKSLAATGRVADGWIPGHAADWLSARYQESRPIIDEAAASVGRDPADIRTIYNLPGRITDRGLPATRGADRRWIGGPPSVWVEELTGAVLQHGATGFILFSPTGGTPDSVSLGRWANEIAPAVRAAVTKESVRNH